MMDRDSHLIFEAMYDTEKVSIIAKEIMGWYQQLGAGKAFNDELRQTIERHSPTSIELRMVVSTITHMPDGFFMKRPGIITDKRSLVTILRLLLKQ